MTKEEILSYVMESPEDTNPSVLRDMLNRLDTSSGSGLQLYGPYVALNTYTGIVGTNETEVLDLDVIYDLDDNEVEFPSDITNVICVMAAFSIGSSFLSCDSIVMPSYNPEGQEWVPYKVFTYNHYSSSLEILAYGTYIQFYTNIPLPIKPSN